MLQQSKKQPLEGLAMEDDAFNIPVEKPLKQKPSVLLYVEAGGHRDKVDVERGGFGKGESGNGWNELFSFTADSNIRPKQNVVYVMDKECLPLGEDNSRSTRVGEELAEEKSNQLLDENIRKLLEQAPLPPPWASEDIDDLLTALEEEVVPRGRSSESVVSNKKSVAASLSKTGLRQSADHAINWTESKDPNLDHKGEGHSQGRYIRNRQPAWRQQREATFAKDATAGSGDQVFVQETPVAQIDAFKATAIDLESQQHHAGAPFSQLQYTALHDDVSRVFDHSVSDAHHIKAWGIDRTNDSNSSPPSLATERRVKIRRGRQRVKSDAMSSLSPQQLSEKRKQDEEYIVSLFEELNL